MEEREHVFYLTEKETLWKRVLLNVIDTIRPKSGERESIDVDEARESCILWKEEKIEGVNFWMEANMQRMEEQEDETRERREEEVHRKKEKLNEI